MYNSKTGKIHLIRLRNSYMYYNILEVVIDEGLVKVKGLTKGIINTEEYKGRLHVFVRLKKRRNGC